MAAVSIPNSPHTVGIMSSRRLPLANVPNVANSPFRAVAAAASKRQRSHVEESEYEQLRPAKKQNTGAEESILRTPARKHNISLAEGRVFNKRSTTSQPTAFDRKLLAAKDAQIAVKITPQERATAENYETIKQWQKHYKKVFPSFIFYFESVSEDIRAKCSRQLGGLGAREEKFFSRDVTHIITTRSIPVESELSTPTDTAGPSSTATSSHEHCQPRTINPSLLDKTSENLVNRLRQSRYPLDAQTSRNYQVSTVQDGEVRKQNTASTDILYKGREMGMKIWQLEKLQRILRVMYDAEWESPYQHNHNTRSNVSNTTASTKTGRDTDLSHLLRNEQLHGVSDRESILAPSELVPFKGPHLYIRDINEKTKPVMVRDYPRVQRREEGEWPQFRSVSHGKCPFVEEAIHSRRELQRERSKGQPQPTQAKMEIESASQVQNVQSFESTKMHPPLHFLRKRPLAEMENGRNRGARPVQMAQQIHVEVPVEQKPLWESDMAASTLRHRPIGIGPRLHGGEPIASGVQPSNITSAIRSQMISSTAAAPGVKGGTSKEMHGLQRKVLEKNTVPSMNGISTALHSINQLGATRIERGAAHARLAKIKAQEKLGKRQLIHIEEEHTSSGEEEMDRKAALGAVNALRPKTRENRDPKPGYCENCREKFNDFEEHTLGRKHRKFAVSQDNWKELDCLLKQLIRPLREDNLDDL